MAKTAPEIIGFTPEQEARIREMIEAAIGRLAMRGVASPYRKTVLAGREEDVLASYQAGDSLANVADRFGVPASSVANCLKSAGAEMRPKRRRPGGGCEKSVLADAKEKRAADRVDRIERIRAMRDEGKTLEQIGAIERITRERVRQICAVAGIDTSLEAKPLTEEQKAAVAQYVAGESLNTCAGLLSVSLGAFKNILARAGVEVRPSGRERKTRPATVDRSIVAARLYQEGMSIDDIARKIGYSKGAQIYHLLAMQDIKPSRRPGWNAPMGAAA